MSKSNKKTNMKHEHINKYANLRNVKSNEDKRQRSKSKQDSASPATTPVNTQP
jgi:hypothetical protein